MIKIGMISLGCPKNQVDAELMLGILQDDPEMMITQESAEADVIIVNTCGFIESAKQESIDAILEASGHKSGKLKMLVVTGCMAERYKDEIMNEIPEVDAILGTGHYQDILSVVRQKLGEGKQSVYGDLDAIGYLEGKRVLSTGKGFAYLKIAEGCDNCCTYCIIPSLRGRFRSRKMEDILSEAQSLVSRGVKELILVAQDTTRYGLDIYGEMRLQELLSSLSQVEGVEWVRMLYCYPEALTEKVLQEVASNPKVLPYFDIPVQHISDRVLKAMARRGESGEIRQLFRKIREMMPDAIIRSSLIVGFPGETEEDFEELRAFVAEGWFDRLGVFTYSREEGTPAAKMKGQIPAKVKAARQDTLMKVQQLISSAKADERMGTLCVCLVEGVADDGIFYTGRSFGEAPEIDGQVFITSPEPLEAGQFVRVRLLNSDEYDLIGEVYDESAE